MQSKHTVWEKTENKVARGLLLKANSREDDARVIIHERQVGIARDIIAESSRGYDAVVVGRRGLSKVHEFFWGRVTTKVLHRAAGFALWIVP